MKHTLRLETRKRLSVASMVMRQPAVFVTQTPAAKPQPSSPRQETQAQAEARRQRVDAITRQPPEVILTSKSVYVLSRMDASAAVPMRLPVWERVKLWLRSE